MKFEVDVSGSDIFEENYTICISNKDCDNDIINGFKFNDDLINKLINNWKNKEYKYGLSNKQRGLFKVRLYSIVIYYLFRSIPKQDRLSLTICKDFHGHQNDINQNLKYFLERIIGTQIGKPRHQKLPKDSNAHWYAYLMRKDVANKLFTYVNISLSNFERYLREKKVTPKGLTIES